LAFLARLIRLPWPTLGAIAGDSIPGKAFGLTKTMQLHYRESRVSNPQERDMAAKLEAESTLTDRYQTTVPETVRRALKLGKRDKIRYSIRPGGEVVLTRVGGTAEDPVLDEFLHFLARDMADHPQRLRGLDADLVRRLKKLAGDVPVDLDAPLSPENE
jgi:antitoxin PrlF